jgi:hypothetical protein
MRRLNPREITIVAVGLAVVLCLGFYLLLVQPLEKRRDQMASATKRMEQDLTEMRSLAADYHALEKQRADLRAKVAARDKGFAPFSYLEDLALKAGLSQHIESMTPLASSTEEGTAMTEFEVRLSEIDLNSLVELLFRLESSDKVLFINNLRIQPRYLTPAKLDVTLRVATPASTS